MRYRANRVRLQKLDETPATLLRLSKRNPTELTSDEWLQTFADAQGTRDKISFSEMTATVSLPVRCPIGVVFSSDWHFGSPAMNVQAFRNDLEKVKSDARLYVCVGGDRMDNFQQSFKDASAAVNQLTPPQMQRLAVEAVLKSIADKVVALIGGNHEAMSVKKTGEDGDYWILRDMPFSYFPFGGLLKLTIGEMTYKVLWKHNYRFNSSLNQFNSHHRMQEILCPDSDINVQEHTHSPGIEVIEAGEFDQRRTVVNIRTGTYKGADAFSMNYFKAGRLGAQVVVLWPDHKRITVFHGEHAITDARAFLDGMEAQHGDKTQG